MRYSYIDTLRSLENLLRCIVHASVPFMFIPNPIWPIRSAETHSQAVDGWVFLIHCQTMEVFFAINGFFSLLLLARYDTKTFIFNRLRRIGLPLLAGLVVLIPCVLLLSLSWRNQSTLGEAFTVLPDFLQNNPYPLAHLWSLWYLFFIYAIYFGVKYACVLLKTDLLTLLKNCSTGKALLLSGIVSAIMLMFYHRRFSSAPAETWFEWEMVVYFANFFFLGAWFYVQKERLGSFTIPKYVIGLFILGLAVNMAYQLADLERFGFLKIIGPLAYALQTHCTILYVVRWTMRINWQLDFFKRFAEASYWTYWIELPLVMLWQWLWIDTIPVWIFLPFSIVVTFFIGFQSFHRGFKATKLAHWLGFV